MSGHIHGNGNSAAADHVLNGDADEDEAVAGEELEDLSVSPEMLFKISKKIAQLTKVIYSLNTRNDDLEVDLSAHKRALEGAENGSETKKELRKARHIMKHLEAKMKAMEEDSKRRKSEKSTPEKQIGATNSTQELEWTHKLDHLEIKNEQMRLENEQLKRDVAQADKERSQCQLQLSAARVHLKYNDATSKCANPCGMSITRSKSVDEEEDKQATMHMVTRERDRLTKELQKVQTEAARQQVRLHQEQEEVSKMRQTLQAERQRRDEEAAQLRREHEEAQTRRQQEAVQAVQAAQIEVEQLTAKRQQEADKLRKEHQDEVRQLREENLHLQAKNQEREEASLLRQRGELVAQHAKDVSKKDVEIARLRSELDCAKQKYDKDVQAHLDGKRKLVVELEAAKNARASDARKSERKQQDLSQEVEQARAEAADARARLERESIHRDKEVTEANEMAKGEKHEVLLPAGTDLEAALEEALVEREQILAAASKEIEQAKTMAMRTEQKMMDDFEWKLRQLESDHRARLRELDQSADARVAAAVKDYQDKKDAEFTRLSIALRRESEDVMRAERLSLRAALDAQTGDSDAKFQREKDRALRMQQKTWEEERNRLHREKRSLQRRLDEVPEQVRRASAEVRAEGDVALSEERRRSARALDKAQEDFDAMRDDLLGQMTRLRATHADETKALQNKLESANTDRFSSMFQMKEEVEIEFSERMEQLRQMYRTEMDTLADKLQREETINRATIKQQRGEIDELNAYCAQQAEEHEAKVMDLLTRLQEQTALAQKLQSELDEYEFYEEDEQGNVTRTEAPKAEIKPAQEQQQQPSAPPRSTRSATVTEEDGTTTSSSLRESWHEERSAATTAEAAEISTSNTNGGSVVVAEFAPKRGRDPDGGGGRGGGSRGGTGGGGGGSGGGGGGGGSSSTLPFTKVQGTKTKKRSPGSTGSNNSKKSNCTHQ